MGISNFHGSTRRSSLTVGLLAGALTAVPAFAAGSHGGGHGHDAGHGHGMAIGAPGQAAKADRTIDVEAADIYFSPESLEVRPGETVRFVIHNTGKLLHEFNIGTEAMHAGHRQEMAKMMEHGMLSATGMNHDMKGIDHGQMGMSHDDPNSVLIEPGQTQELVWTFPEGGTLQFACNVPGHSEAGMQGEINIGK